MRTREKKNKSLHKHFLSNHKQKTRNRRKKRSVRRRRGGAPKDDYPKIFEGIKKSTKLAMYIGLILILFRKVPLLETLNVANKGFTELGQTFLSFINTSYSCFSGSFLNSFDKVSAMVFGVEDPAAFLAGGAQFTASAAATQADFTAGVGLNIGVGATIMALFSKRNDDGTPNEIMWAWNKFVDIIVGGVEATVGDVFEQMVAKLNRGLFEPIIAFKETVINSAIALAMDATDNMKELGLKIMSDINDAAEEVANLFILKIVMPTKINANSLLETWNTSAMDAEGKGVEIGEGLVFMVEQHSRHLFDAFIVGNECYKKLAVPAGAFVKVLYKLNYKACEVSTYVFYKICTFLNQYTGEDDSINAMLPVDSDSSSDDSSISLLMPPTNSDVLLIRSNSLPSRLEYRSGQGGPAVLGSPGSVASTASYAASPQSPLSFSPLTDDGSYGKPDEYGSGASAASAASGKSAASAEHDASLSPGGIRNLFGENASSDEEEEALVRRRRPIPSDDDSSGYTTASGGRKMRGGKFDPSIPIRAYMCLKSRSHLDFMTRQAYGAANDLMIGSKDGLTFLLYKEDDVNMPPDMMNRYIDIFKQSIQRTPFQEPKTNEKLSKLIRRLSITGGYQNLMRDVISIPESVFS